MLDKRKELENLENKYKEIDKLNSEIELIISNIKNDVEISREKELSEKNTKLEKNLKSFSYSIVFKDKYIIKGLFFLNPNILTLLIPLYYKNI